MVCNLIWERVRHMYIWLDFVMSNLHFDPRKVLDLQSSVSFCMWMMSKELVATNFLTRQGCAKKSLHFDQTSSPCSNYNHLRMADYFPCMTSRPGLQILGLVQKDGMNGLIAGLWHHLGCELTKIKKIPNASTIAFVKFMIYNVIPCL